MGLFLSCSSIPAASEAEAVDFLSSYAESRGGFFVREELVRGSEDRLVIASVAAGTTILYPFDFYDWEEASRAASLELRRPVFSLHIHDSDFWMYRLYDRGLLVDSFLPIPDYWSELQPDERAACRGNASEVARRIPGLRPERLEQYLIEWTEEILMSGSAPRPTRPMRFRWGANGRSGISWKPSRSLGRCETTAGRTEQPTASGARRRVKKRPRRAETTSRPAGPWTPEGS